jgi:hypothetical protein
MIRYNSDMRLFTFSSLGFTGLLTIVLSASCGGSNSGGDGFGDAGGGSGGSSGGGSGGGSGGSGSGSGGCGLAGCGDDGGSGSSSGGSMGDPTTCAGAAQAASYIGCDYWPTVTANNVWSIFDYAVVVANAGTQTADITVTGPGNTNQTAQVPPSSLTKIYLPWVSVLKGPDTDNCGTAIPLTSSVLARSAAYHLVSSVPVTVYQFNALEYVGQGGPAGKSWSGCPGDQICAMYGQAVGCYSFSNDASLLLPSTAMTGNYLVTGHEGWAAANLGAYMTITATTDNTSVTVNVSKTGQVLAGGGIPATSAGGKLTLTLNAGDVAELVGAGSDASDLSGSIIQASAPVQVLTGLPCLDVPDSAAACDHVEEANFPAETLGKDYVVPRPTGPHNSVVGQLVRIYGAFNNTTLTYSPSTPGSCPSTINAGQVVECGIINSDFEVKGDNAFGVSIFTQGASVVDPTSQPPNQEGDPDQSLMAAVPQFRTKYVFLAPTDYMENYAVIVTPMGASVALDGAPVTQTPTPVSGTTYGVLRVPIGEGTMGGAHTITSSVPVGLQVMGYGSYTSYMYPGGLDLTHISPPPTVQ